MFFCVSSCASKKALLHNQNNTKEIPTISENKILRLPFTKAVYSIFVDSKGNTWIGSREEGVCQISKNNMNCFTSANGLIDNQVRMIQEDSKGNIWLSSDKGVTHYDGEKFIIHNETELEQSLGNKQITWHATTKKPQLLGGNGIDIYKYEKSQPDYFFGNNNSDLKNQFSLNNLWFNAGGFSGAFSFNGNKLNYLPFPLPSNNLNQSTSKNYYPVTMIHKGKKNLWFSSYSGFFGFDGKTMIVLNNKSFGFDEISQQFHIRGIFEDSNGNLWLGNNGLGVGVLKYDGNSFFSFTEKNGFIKLNKARGIKEVPENDGIGRVFSINEDDDGNIWFGTRDNGAWLYDGKTLKQFSTKDGLSSNYIRVIYKDGFGQMWFGAGDGSVHQFNGTSFARVY